ncbi:GntR family transcriptional regulator, partial [Martelella sp. UBA3392]
MAPKPLALDIGKDAPGPLFLAIAGAITRDIVRGRLKPGARLPGTRALAREIGVHRNTVDAAYQELTTQGWLYAEPARGTFVAEDLPDSMAEPVSVSVPPRPSAVRPALAFSDGAPDPNLVPDKALARAFRRALLSPAFRTGADYGDARGTSVLRHALSSYLALDRGVVADPARLLITRGSQMAL